MTVNLALTPAAAIADAVCDLADDFPYVLATATVFAYPITRRVAVVDIDGVPCDTRDDYDALGAMLALLTPPGTVLTRTNPRGGILRPAPEPPLTTV